MQIWQRVLILTLQTEGNIDWFAFIDTRLLSHEKQSPRMPKVIAPAAVFFLRFGELMALKWSRWSSVSGCQVERPH
jgi:hypothetical protein